MNRNILLMVCIALISLSTISAITIIDVSSSPSEINPGEVATISIEIENIFEEEVNNLEIKLDLENTPFAPYQSSSEQFLEELDDGDEEEFTFKLIALPDVDSGIYKIPVKITYDYNNETSKEKDELISLTVNSKPNLKVSLEDSVTLVKGKENEIIIKIVNSGLGDAKFVYLEPSEVSGIKILTNKEQYVGDIDSDDFDSIKYKIYLDPESSNLISLPVILKYRDGTNTEYIETKTISLKTYSLKEAQRLGLVQKQNYFIYFGIGGVILIYIIYRFRKKRKLKKKKEN